MRAFLSHSSTDKEFVESVSKQLGRQFCVFDTYEFRTGLDFREAIRTALEKSSLFVLFASKTSLKSTWVKFEENEAELMSIKGGIRRPLVFLINDGTSHKGLPEWLKRSRVRPITSPRAVAREIIFHLQELMREKQQPLFVGRRKELEEAENRLLSYDENGPKRIFLLFGLSGIGRRTFARKISVNFLSFEKIIVFRTEEGDNINDIAVKFAEQAEVYSNLNQLKTLVEEIEKSTEDEALDRIKKDTEILIGNGELPVLFDVGGLLDNDGSLSKSVLNIISKLSTSEELYLAMISTRKPVVDSSTPPPTIPIIRVDPLSDPEVARLLGKLAANNRVKCSTQELSELSAYIRGFPPAAHYAMELIKEYGLPSVLSDKHPLVDFRTSHFFGYIEKSGFITDDIRLLLGVLSYYSPLPLVIIGEVLSLDASLLQERIAYLIDMSIVIPDESGLYRLSDPVVDSVQKLINRMEVPHKEVVGALKRYLADSEEELGLLELSRNLFRARRFAGMEGVDDSEINLVSDVISLETDFYHARQYENAIRMGNIALEERPDSAEARGFIVRSLVQLGRYQDAQTHITYLRDAGYLRDAYFLTGLMERHKGYLHKAIDAYEKAIQRGRRGLAVHRELANCYFRIGNIDNARKHIQIAERIDPGNKYLIDLMIVIAVSGRDEDVARNKLRELKEVDSEGFYEHRRSTVEYVFGSKEESYVAASNAVESTERPTFAMLSQLAKSAIATKRLDEAAKTINEIEHRFRATRHDIKTGLRCRLEISLEEYGDAITLWEQLKDKEKKIHKILKRDAIEGLLTKELWKDETEQKNLSKELEALNKELKDDVLDLLDAELEC